MSKLTHISDPIHRVVSSSLILPNDDKQSLSGCISLEILDEGKCLASAPAAANDKSLEQVREKEGMMAEVFDAVSAVKRAYVSLQRAQSPWDPDKMRTADAAMVADLKRLGRARDRYRRRRGGAAKVAPPLSEAVAPYEAAIEDLRGEVKAREEDVEMLKEKLRNRGRGSGGADNQFDTRISKWRSMAIKIHHISGKVCYGYYLRSRV